MYGLQEPEYDEFKDSEKRIKKLDVSLKQFRENDDESFYLSILYGSYFKLKDLNADFPDDLEALLGTKFLEQLEGIRPKLFLDLNIETLERQ